MNILYYGANNTINDKIIDNTLHNQTRIHKSIRYLENSQYLTFSIINIHILQFVKSKQQLASIQRYKEKRRRRLY